ncbi:MAG TPA: DUF1801 domain-containing protein [Methanomassiliicoccales archaeon]|nr:DUF1801 domain-containing protein [Methanomassiliicoccales archaeon]
MAHENAPGVRESISYGIPTFKLERNLVHFGARGRYVSLYPLSSGVDAFRERLREFKLGRGTVQFPQDRPIPCGLIAEIVRSRVQQESDREIK